MHHEDALGVMRQRLMPDKFNELFGVGSVQDVVQGV
jgi:hypothetical protein